MDKVLLKRVLLISTVLIALILLSRIVVSKAYQIGWVLGTFISIAFWASIIFFAVILIGHIVKIVKNR